MNRKYSALVDRLATSSEELVWYVGKLAGTDLTAPPAPNEWSIHQALAHLRDTEQHVFLYRAPRILKEDAPRVPLFNQEMWQKEHYSASEPLKKILLDFTTARRKLIALLRKTKDKDWARYAVHPDYGNISLEWLVTHCYNHTLEHIVQVGYVYEKQKLLPTLK